MLAIVRQKQTGTAAKSLRNCGARVKDCAMSALLLGSRTHAPLDDGARWNIHIHKLLYFCLRHAHPRSTRRAGLTLPDCGKRGLIINRSVALSTGDPVRTHGGSLLKLWRMNSTKQHLKQDSETICRQWLCCLAAPLEGAVFRGNYRGLNYGHPGAPKGYFWGYL